MVVSKKNKHQKRKKKGLGEGDIMRTVRVLCLNCYLIKSAMTLFMLELFLRIRIIEVILPWIYYDSDSILFLQNLRVWLVLPHNINTNINKWLLKGSCQKQMWHIITKKIVYGAEMYSNPLFTYFISNFPGWKNTLFERLFRKREILDQYGLMLQDITYLKGNNSTFAPCS